MAQEHECPEQVRRAVTRVLQGAILSVRNRCDDRDDVFDEADHVHNLPSLLLEFAPEKLNFSFNVEREGSLEKAAPFVDEAWRELEPFVEADPLRQEES